MKFWPPYADYAKKPSARSPWCCWIRSDRGTRVLRPPADGISHLGDWRLSSAGVAAIHADSPHVPIVKLIELAISAALWRHQSGHASDPAFPRSQYLHASPCCSAGGDGQVSPCA